MKDLNWNEGRHLRGTENSETLSAILGFSHNLIDRSAVLMSNLEGPCEKVRPIKDLHRSMVNNLKN